jgi:hypothetical protein
MKVYRLQHWIMIWKRGWIQVVRILISRMRSSNSQISVSRNCMRSYIFWNITLSSPLRVNRRFGGTCCLLLPASCWFLALLSLRHWRWKQFFLPKRRLNFNGLYDFIFRRHFITTAVGTSNPTVKIRSTEVRSRHTRSSTVYNLRSLQI